MITNPPTDANSERIYCATIDDIKKVGAKKWSEHFNWPLAPDVVPRIRDAIVAFYRDQIDKASPEAQDILIVQFKIIHILFNFLHVKCILKSATETHDQILCASSNPYYNFAFHSDASQTEWPHTHQTLAKPLSQPERIRLALRALKKTILTNPLGILSPQNCVNNIGSVCSIKNAFVTREGRHLLFRNASAFVQNQIQIPQALDQELNEITRNIQGFMDTQSQKLGIDFDDQQWTHIQNIIHENLYSATQFYLSAQRQIKKTRIQTFLLGGLGNIVHRAICKAAQREGRHVIGVSHGNAIGIKLTPLVSINDFSVVDTYLVPTTGAGKTYTALSKERFFALSDHSPEITSVETDHYSHIWQTEKSKPLPTKIKRVMFIEFPLAPFMDPYFGDTSYTIVQLDLAIRAMATLRNAGFHVILKAHPDRLKESGKGGLYEDCADEINTEPFETVTDQADAFVFPHIGTSTLGPALSTNKPIAYFEIEPEFFEPDAKNLFDQRCSPIPIWRDKRNRIAFDPKVLIETLSIPPKSPDAAYLETYMQPKTT